MRSNIVHFARSVEAQLRPPLALPEVLLKAGRKEHREKGTASSNSTRYQDLSSWYLR
jgi:hypothetical protein